MPKTKKTIGELIDDLAEIRDQRRELKTQDDELRAQYVEIEATTIEEMKKQSLEKASGDLASASISENEVPSVKDWNKLTSWIKKNAAYHLFERRVSKAAWSELVTNRKGRPLPGVESFEKVSLNIRARS